MVNWYKDLEVRKQNKIAVVICSYVGEEGYHYQNDPLHAQKYFEDLQFTLSAHEKLKDTTLPYDLIVVDNGSTYQPLKEWLIEWANRDNHIVFERDNEGFSYGAFNYAWDWFKVGYDYYLFCEQDIMPCKEHWLEELLLAFHSEVGIGMVGTEIESHPGERFLLFRKQVINLAGPFFFTSSKILKEVGIKIHKGTGTAAGVTNEINFSQFILEAGYKIKGLYDDNRTYTKLSDGSANNLVEPIADTIVPFITIHIRERTDERSVVLQNYLKEKGLL